MIHARGIEIGLMIEVVFGSSSRDANLMTALVGHDTISTRARHKMARNDDSSCKSKFDA